MLKNLFDATLPYLAVLYLRMSSDRQNPRSPDQQADEIKRRLKSSNHPWRIVQVYRDNAKSGKLLRNRKDFQRMLRELKTGTVKADLILVDTVERFARVDELSTIRKELYERHGILVLTADSNFADPNTSQGRALGMVETVRATEDGRVKAHNVLRGKRDAVALKRWPGGPPPFGYKLESVMTHVRGFEEVDHLRLVPDPPKRRIIEQLFELAETTSYGSTRLARALNDDRDIPSKYKPFQSETIAYWLNSKIYLGDMYWGVSSTGVANDMRVVERNSPEDVLFVPEFCEPLVTRERWENVQTVRRVRRERISAARRRKSAPDGKLIVAPAPGLTVKYILSGLLFCECGLRMAASSGSAYFDKDGIERRSTSYGCPGYRDGHCANAIRVPEAWVRNAVIDKVRERLFPELAQGCDGQSDGPHDSLARMLTWLPGLAEQVVAEAKRLTASKHDQRPSLVLELERLREDAQGWAQSLAKPTLSPALRTALEGQWEAAIARQQEIDAELAQLAATAVHVESIVEPQDVCRRLKRLADVLAAVDPTRCNLELSLHIDRISCFKDGRVQLRMCKLGILPNACEFLALPKPKTTNQQDATAGSARARRRGRLRVIEDNTEVDLHAQADFAADVDRFKGLDDEWFWIDDFIIPQSFCWAAQNAEAVFRRRQSTRSSFAKLAAEFDVTPPTIRAAVRRYLADHPDEKDIELKRGGKRKPKFDLAKFADEARELWIENWSKEKLAKKYGCSAPTVHKAIAFAYDRAGQTMPTREEARRDRVDEARRLLKAGKQLDEIAATMRVSDATARGYIRESFTNAGEKVPDLRRRERA